MALQLPVLTFITARLQETDPNLEVRAGTGFYDLFVKPQQIMLQPLLQALEVSFTAQSVLRIQNTGNTDNFDTDLVDQLTQNLFVYRSLGQYGTTVCQLFYGAPVDRDFPAGSVEFLTSTGLSFFNSTDISVTSQQMALNTSNALYYILVPVIAAAAGADYNVDAGDIVACVNDPEALSVTNISDVTDGLDTQTNTEILDQVENSIGVRDFETGKGIVAIINQDFPGIFSEIVAIGMGDPEMQRDIVYNAHVGGCTDVYLLTPALQTITQNFIGLQFDSTRQLNQTLYKQLFGDSFTDPSADLGTPFIVVGSMTVTSDVVETAAQIASAHVPVVTGINLVGAEFIKVRMDLDGIYVNIKVSGANPAATQQFEIINSINAALGETVAVAFGADQIAIVSQTIGFGSQVNFATPDSPRTDATPILFPAIVAAPYNYVSGVSGVGVNPAATVLGVVKTTYIETVDYVVDYADGLVAKTPGSAILTGDVIVGPATNGVLTAGGNVLSSLIPNAFALVQPGDIVTITASTALAPGTYVVQSKVDSRHVTLQGVHLTLTDTSVSYNIVSNQVVVLKFQYNPLSIDIGGQVLLADGNTRGVRPGRAAFTITNIPYLTAISVAVIDPNTQQPLGTNLYPNVGYGGGGYGTGGYGIGRSGDYYMVVNVPSTRFSMFEDSLLVFDKSWFGQSLQITYYAAPEVAEVHTLSRSDLERVTGADVLPKNFVPAFVDFNVNMQRDPNNINMPTDTALVTQLQGFVNAITSSNPLEASSIVQLLKDQGALYVQVPFTMTMTIINTDGSNSIITSQDVLQVPNVTLLSDSPNYVTPRITQMYARNITITEVTP